MISFQAPMAQLKLYCAWFCPFAQRAWVALLEKGVPFTYVEYNPYRGNTPEFLDLNPRGLVPVLETGGQGVYESNVCVEYVDEIGPKETQLLPIDPLERAKSRLMCEYISREIVPLWYGMLLKQNTSVQEGIKSLLLENLKTLMNMKFDGGPYLLGNTFGMPDILLVPFTMRFPVLEHYRGFTVPDSEDFNTFREWMTASHNNRHVVATTPSADKAIKVYESYADGTAKVRSKI